MYKTLRALIGLIIFAAVGIFYITYTTPSEEGSGSPTPSSDVSEIFSEPEEIQSLGVVLTGTGTAILQTGRSELSCVPALQDVPVNVPLIGGEIRLEDGVVISGSLVAQVVVLGIGETPARLTVTEVSFDERLPNAHIIKGVYEVGAVSQIFTTPVTIIQDNDELSVRTEFEYLGNMNTTVSPIVCTAVLVFSFQ